MARAQGWDPGLTDFDRVLGAADAPLTVVEYASFTCPHCATFHAETLATVKERYIDTGQVRYVFRDFPLDGLALRAGMLARCVPEDRYFPLVDVLFSSQREWSRAADPVTALSQIGRMVGLTQDEIDACLQDDALADRLIALRTEGTERFGVESTPSFVINGETVSGALPFDRFAELLDRHLS
ncbi:MAG: DsbA family protein [Inquilinaceae bacterium]